MVLTCLHCNTTVKTEVLKEYDRYNEYDPMDGEKYSFCKCPNCFEPIVTKSPKIYSFEGFDWGTPVIIFPVSQFHINPAIPKEIRDALTESIKCFEADLFTPTVIMCRRTLEGFCQLMGIKKKVPLVKALEELKNKEIINSQLYMWATLLREMGNDAAHNTDINFSYADAKDLLDFTIAILDFTYSFKDKFDKFRKRKSEN